MHFQIILNFYLILISTLLQQTFSATMLDNIENRAEGFLRDLGIRRKVFEINEADHGNQLVTNLDRFHGLFVLARHLSLNQAFSNMKDLYRENIENGKMQDIIPPNIPFPCNLTNARSSQIPTSIHRLRPGDIDIVASFGDSLSAGNGIISTNIMHILNEHRGYVFSAGGMDNWRHILTLPNILKVFNSNLYGYSTADGLTVDSISHLNIAEPMLMSRDMPYQAKVLVSRLRLDPHVDMKNHWKVLTIFNGCNDICSDLCHHDRIEDFLAQHERDLRRTFTILRDAVPRLLVNLLPATNMVTTLHRMRNVPLMCQLVHAGGCHCVFNQRYNSTYLNRVSGYIKRWQMIDERMGMLPEFQTNDFAVIYHPFLANPSVPSLPNGDTDFRYFASDCFHFSQLGHAGLANSLWNSMLQPIGKKQNHITMPFDDFQCPSQKRPFIATLDNS